MTRPNPKPQSSQAVTLAGSVPWRERPFLQMKAASEIAGVSITTLYRFSDAGTLKLRDFGGRTLVDTPSFVALIETAKEWKPRNRGQEARAARKAAAKAALR